MDEYEIECNDTLMEDAVYLRKDDELLRLEVDDDAADA